MSNSILISIHPNHAYKIISGEKKIEFRRRWTKQEISKLIIYVTMPVQKILAVCNVKEVIEHDILTLCKLSKSGKGCLTKSELLQYFENRKTGFAIVLDEVKVLKSPLDPFKAFNNFSPPQSFRYAHKNEILLLNKKFK